MLYALGVFLDRRRGGWLTWKGVRERSGCQTDGSITFPAFPVVIFYEIDAVRRNRTILRPAGLSKQVAAQPLKTAILAAFNLGDTGAICRS